MNINPNIIPHAFKMSGTATYNDSKHQNFPGKTFLKNLLIHLKKVTPSIYRCHVSNEFKYNEVLLRISSCLAPLTINLTYNPSDKIFVKNTPSNSAVRRKKFDRVSPKAQEVKNSSENTVLDALNKALNDEENIYNSGMNLLNLCDTALKSELLQKDLVRRIVTKVYEFSKLNNIDLSSCARRFLERDINGGTFQSHGDNQVFDEKTRKELNICFSDIKKEMGEELEKIKPVN